METDKINHYLKLELQGNALKDVIQKDAVNTWLSEGGKGVIKAFTGFGKSTIARIAIRRYTTKFPNNEILVIVPSTNLKNDWIALLQEIGVIYYTVKVINGFALNLEPKEKTCKLFIVDEVHHCLGVNAVFFNKVIQDTKFDYFLGLTATLTKDNEDYLNNLGLKVSFDITINEGARLKLLPDFIIFNLGVDLDEESKLKYVKASLLYEESFKPFSLVGKDQAFALAMCCAIMNKKDYSNKRAQSDDMDVDVYETLYNLQINGRSVKCTREQAIMEVMRYTGLERKEVISQANIWLKTTATRKEILQDSENKLKLVHEYLDTSRFKTIVFAGGKEISKKIQQGNLATTLTYNSDQSVKIRKETLRLFETNIIQNLITIRTLDEGYDLKSIDTALNLDYTGNEGTFIQRLGRTVRNDENNSNKIAKMINFYHKPFFIMLEGFEYKVIPQDLKKLKAIQKNAINVQLINSLEEFYANSI